MAFKEYSISSTAELIRRLRQVYGAGKTVWFRGHADYEWHLEPYLARRKKLSCEMQLMKKFKQNAFQFLQRVPQEEWEWMLLMQHYRVPTRLLDWTESPLVGLYFALLDRPRSSPPAAASLWCLYRNRPVNPPFAIARASAAPLGSNLFVAINSPAVRRQQTTEPASAGGREEPRTSHSGGPRHAWCWRGGGVATSAPLAPEAATASNLCLRKSGV